MQAWRISIEVGDKALTRTAQYAGGVTEVETKRAEVTCAASSTVLHTLAR